MNSNYVNISEIREAYRKLKTQIYYDSYNLHLRVKLAEFEANNNIEEVFSNLCNNINENNIANYLNKIATNILPKKNVRNDSLNNNKNLLRNDTCVLDDEIILDDTNYNFYIDAPIEVYLIDVLWIIKEGCFLINENIKKDCYGNKLVFDNNKLNNIKQGAYLFDRYFDNYQKWRDNGIKVAKEQIKNKNDVLLVCLDIQRFYPTSQINFNKIRKILEEKKINLFFTNLLESIYIKYQKIVTDLLTLSESDPQLPIGLFSSGVIANWYLSDFDISMKETFAPIYYGRYVDDIFMVLANVQPNNDENWFDKKFLSYNDAPLTIVNENSDTNSFYQLRSHSNLRINNKKIKLFYFSPNHSLAVLDKFQKTLEENSSAFWFLPDGNETLNSNGFEITYEDTINKFREISDIKNNKFGISTFLAKQIRVEIICKDASQPHLTKELFRYFIGDRLIEMFSLWEKVFTFFVVKGDGKSIQRFERKILDKIDKLSVKNNSTCTTLLKKSLKDYCLYSKSMAISLNLDIQVPINKLANKLRKTYLLRQHYLPLPILVYTTYDKNKLIGYDVLHNLKGLDKKLSFRTDCKCYNPRKIHAHEISIINLYNYINGFNHVPHLENIKELIDIDLFDNMTIDSVQQNINSNFKVNIQNVKFPVVNQDIKNCLKVALSNIKIHDKDIISAIKGEQIFNNKKRERHFHLLNLATKEKVDCLVLPELSLPLELLMTYAEQARRKQQLIIAGLEHILVKDTCYNLTVVFIPYMYKGSREVLILPRLKNYYSIEETRVIKKYGKDIPSISHSVYHLINWQGVQFTVFNCYELTDIFHRSLFKSEIDVLFAIEYNKDTLYYSNIVESACRDLHCYIVQANTSDFGDSRCSIPKKTVEMTPVKIKGGDNDTIITFTLDIRSLRDFQMQDPLFQNKEDFKNTPPGFSIENVKNRF